MRSVAIALGIASVVTQTAVAQSATDLRLDAPSSLLMVTVSKSSGVSAGVSSDQKLRVWDSQAKRVLHTIDVTGRSVALMALSGDGRLLLLGDYAGRVTIWNTATGQVEWEPRPPRYLTAAAFSRDGRLLALVPGSPVQLYNVTTRQLVRTLEPTTGTTSVAFSRDGNSVATTDGEGVRIYDVRTGRRTTQSGDFVSEPLAVDFSADGKSVFAGGGDRIVVTLDAATGKTLRRSATLPDPVFYIETSPNGSEVAVVTQNADDPQRPAPIVLADAASLAAKTTWRSPAGVLLPGTAWRSDGTFTAATQSAGALHLWAVR